MKKSQKNIFKVSILAGICGLCVGVGAVSMPNGVIASASTTGIAMETGASIRLIDEEKGVKDGIRFTMTIAKEVFEGLDASATSGILLAKTNDAGTFDYNKAYNLDTSNAWFKVYEDEAQTKYHYASRACITDIGAEYYDVKLSAVGYVKVGDNYTYTDYTVENNSRSMMDVAKAAIKEYNADPVANYANIKSCYEYLTVGEIGNNYVYQVDSEAIYALPDFEEEKPEYEVVGPNGAVEVLNGNKIVLKDAGEYTATMGDNTVKFAVYSKEAYAKVIAPLNSDQSAKAISANDKNVVSCNYDATMDAYKVEPIQHVGDRSNLITVAKDSVEYTKMAAGFGVYSYLAVDMYFTHAPGTSFLFWLSTKGGAYPIGMWFGELKIYDQTTKTVVSYDQAVANRWYTFYIDTAGFNEDPTATRCKFITQDAIDGLNYTYYMKDIRFENQIGVATTVENGYIYNVNDTIALDKYGALTLTDPSGNVVTANANGSYTLAVSGEYTVQGNGKTIKFRAMTEAEKAKMIAPLTSEQYAGTIVAANPSVADFAFDATMGAYKVTPLKHVNDDNNGIKVADSATLTKIADGCEKYTYFAMDMYFSQAPGTTMMFWMDTETGARPTQVWYGEMQIFDANGNAVAKDANGVPMLEAGQWYTFYMQTGGLNFYNFLFSQRLDANNLNYAYWVKDIRFADSIG